MNHPNPTKAVRLTEQDRVEMRQLREAKPWLWSYQALAEYFGCSRWTAMTICKQLATFKVSGASDD